MNFQFSRTFLFVTTTVALASSTIIPSFVRLGTCADLHQQHDFNLAKFSGLWYVILQVPNEFIAITRCLTSNYTIVQADGSFINNRYGLADNGSEVTTATELSISDDDKHSFFIPFKQVDQEIGIIIAETDYENYACAYSCLQRWFFKAEIVIVLSRSPTIKKKYVELCKKVITEQSSFSWSNMRVMEQGPTCPYWEGYKKDSVQGLNARTSFSDMVDKIDEGIQALMEKSEGEDSEMEEIFFEIYSRASRSSNIFHVILVGLLNVFLLNQYRDGA